MQDDFEVEFEFEIQGDISGFTETELLEIMNTALAFNSAKGWGYDADTGELFILPDETIDVPVPNKIIQWAKKTGDT